MRRYGLLIITLALLPGGCGTLLNINDMERLDLASRLPDEKGPYERPAFPFGGVANNVAWITNFKEPIDVVHSCIDLPFSLVGDIVTLPWTVYPRQPAANAWPEEWKRFWMEPTPDANKPGAVGVRSWE